MRRTFFQEKLQEHDNVLFQAPFSGATPESESELSMTILKRISGLTLISNQILQKGTARMAAVLFPGLITFHCSLLMSQLFLSSHNYTVFICSLSCGQTPELQPCLQIGEVCCTMILQRKSTPKHSHSPQFQCNAHFRWHKIG